MSKPAKKSFKTAYDWNEVENFIENKYNVKLRGYKREVDGEYRDFWHFLLDRCDIKRGSFFHLPEDMGGAEPWQIEIMEMILKEFPELEHESLWVDW